MTAAERGISLEVAVRAFAAERDDRIGRRALDLADYLEAGLPLALACNGPDPRFRRPSCWPRNWVNRRASWAPRATERTTF